MNFKIDTLITFLKSNDLEKTHYFYSGFLGLPLIADQGICRIYETPFGSVGFCTHYNDLGSAGLVCFVLDSREDVDALYWSLEKEKDKYNVTILSAPVYKEVFGIYQFYAKDPSDNLIEFQCFG